MKTLGPELDSAINVCLAENITWFIFNERELASEET